MDQGALIPDELGSASAGFVPMRGKVEDFLKRDQFPSSIDMFLHDSSHSYRHMLWEFHQFWPRLRDGGLLVSHDVQMNAAFPEFVTKTYAHDRKDRPPRRTTDLALRMGPLGLHRPSLLRRLLARSWTTDYAIRAAMPACHCWRMLVPRIHRCALPILSVVRTRVSVSSWVWPLAGRCSLPRADMFVSRVQQCRLECVRCRYHRA